MAQSKNERPVSTAFAVLSKSLESRSSTIGDEVMLRTISDVLVDGQVVIPKGSKVLAHIAGAVIKGKDEPQSMLAVVIDKAISVDGVETPLQAIIVAIAAPQSSLASDPTYGMLHSNEPKMIGTGPRGAASGLSASSKANSNAAVATAELKGRMDESLWLTEDSQGAIGYEGISISWHLSIPPPLTEFRSKAKSVKLEAGTQMLVRMASPRLPR